MRILQILPEMNVGGVETGTVDLGRYLVEHGHGSVVISNGGKLVKQLEKEGSRHYALPVHQKSIWSMISLIKKVRQIIIDENIDIVHARSRVPAWIAYFACLKTSTFYVTTCHGHYKSKFFSQVMGWGKRVIVPSEIIGRHMIDQYHVHTELIRKIPRSVDLAKFKDCDLSTKSAGKCVIIMIGRITPLKGHTFFIKAMAKVVRSLPQAEVWIVGDAPKKKQDYKEELFVLTKRLGLQEHVKFLGNRSDIPELLSQSHVLVLSTVTQEAFGRVILEAQAAKVPVVATNVGGVMDIIENEVTGLLVMPKDIDGMAQAVIRVVKDPSLADKMIAAATEKLLNQYTLDHMASQTIAVYKEVLEEQNILIIKMTSIGDVILATGSIQAVRRKYPKATLYCLVDETAKKILQHCPDLDGVIVVDLKHKHRHIFGLWRLARHLRRFQFDKVIDFQNNRKSHWLGFLTLARERYGYDNGKASFLLNKKIKDDFGPLPPVEHQFKILEMLDIRYHPKIRLNMWPESRDEKYVAELLEEHWLKDYEYIVGINLSASEKWMTKNWPVEHIATLCDMLSAKNIRVIMTGVEKDLPTAQTVLQKAKSKPANFVGKTDLHQLAALIKHCKVFITPDSAPLHIAAAVKTPIVALFGPTSSKRHLPPADEFVVLERNLECAPCYSSRCKIFTHACMKDITPEVVYEQVLKLHGVNA
ncbi:MAG: lipopolysaccharide heptosyltransferase II [Candidatus Omnitrophica bacterium]|nr:lipopolysaccharide heptosyltransferase II [Candidatus Omnitrophota bacterium]